MGVVVGSLLLLYDGGTTIDADQYLLCCQCLALKEDAILSILMHVFGGS